MSKMENREKSADSDSFGRLFGRIVLTAMILACLGVGILYLTGAYKEKSWISEMVEFVLDIALEILT